LSAGGIRNRQPAARLIRRYRDVVVDRGCRDADALRVPRRPVHRCIRPQGRRQSGVHGGGCGARRGAPPLRAAAGVYRRHVSARSLRPHRHRRNRGRERKVSQSYERPLPVPPPQAGEGTLWRGLRKIVLGAVVTTAALVAATAAWIVSLGPGSTGQDLEFSTVVVDRDGQVLRPYATSDGRWRLPATVESVDPRYLAAL